MAEKTISIEIGHWYNPEERNPEPGLWEFKFNYVVGREVKRQLERHGFNVIVNGNLGVFEEKGGLEKTFKWWEEDKEHRSLGGIRAADFYSLLMKKINTGEIDLKASVSVHFNAQDSQTQGFLTVRRNNASEETIKICKCVENEMIGLAAEIKPPYVKQNPEDDYAMCKLPCPCAYCECGFYDNPADRQRFNTAEKQMNYGTAIAKGVLNYLEMPWKPYFYVYDRFPKAKEYIFDIKDNSVVAVYDSVNVDNANNGVDIREVNNGCLYYKGDASDFLKISENIYAYANRFDLKSVYNDIPGNSLILYRGTYVDGLYRIENGCAYYKKGEYTGVDRIYAYERDFPDSNVRALLPKGSLIVVYRTVNYKLPGLHQICNGNIYYKI